MSRAKKPLLCSLNEHLICNLCKGYFIDATTIIECLHTFCRSCIVKYLETTKYCPICDVQVHKSKPLLSLRSDKIIQDLVYKLVPRLFNNELQRRREYYKKRPEAKPSTFEDSVEASYHSILTPEEELCLTLNYYGSIAKPRYLRCPSAVSIMHLQKLIRAKFDLSESHHVDILHNQDCLSPYYTLMDIVYIYKLSKLEPLDLTYRIYEYMAKKLRQEVQENKAKSVIETTDITAQPAHPTNNNNWKEVQLRISENGEMSITGIQDDILSQNFSPDLIKVLDSKPRTTVSNSYVNPVKRKDVPELKFIGKLPQASSNVNIISDRVIRPENETPTRENLVSSVFRAPEICSVVTVPCLNATTTTVFSTINSTKCSVGAEPTKHVVETVVKDDIKKENPFDKGIKRKLEVSNDEDIARKQVCASDKNDEPVLPLPEPSRDVDAKVAEPKTSEPPQESREVESCSGATDNEDKNKNLVKGTSDSSKQHEEPEVKSGGGSNKIPSRPSTPKPSTKYHGPSQPCYMPKTVYSPVLNVPKPVQSTSTSKSEVKTSTKSVMNVKSEVKGNCVPNSNASSVSTTSSGLNSKTNACAKTKSSTPMGYKTLRDPPKSWNAQISKANFTKPQPDPKYSDPKNVRPAKFFKMRNNMLRFLGNPASGVKPMYSVHVSPEKDKPQEKIVENREIKKHSIVKIDPKTLKPISEKAPETSSLSSQVSTTTDLKINTSSVSIFNPLKLQSSSPKSDRKSPKSPQSPRTKTTSSPSPPVHKRDKPNLNFTPPNPFIPNLSSQTVNPNQFLCSSGPPGFPPYDPRVMAAYHSLLYGPHMSLPPAPLPYHFGGLDINQRGKGFDISKIVGLQQPSSNKSQLSPQSTSKLEPPPIPPQVPYQPRPSPMSLKSSNCSMGPKKPAKDYSKNEKSLQNTVEKLTMSRAKEIYKAAEDVNKLSRSCANPVDAKPTSNDDKGTVKSSEKKPSNNSCAATNLNETSRSIDRNEEKSKDKLEAKKDNNVDCQVEQKKLSVVENSTEKIVNNVGTKKDEGVSSKRTSDENVSADTGDNMKGTSDNLKKEIAIA